MSVRRQILDILLRHAQDSSTSPSSRAVEHGIIMSVIVASPLKCACVLAYMVQMHDRPGMIVDTDLCLFVVG